MKNNSTAAPIVPEVVSPDAAPPVAPMRKGRTKKVIRETREEFIADMESDEAPAARAAADPSDTADDMADDATEIEEYDTDPLTEFLMRFEGMTGLRMQATRYADPPSITPRVPCYELTAFPRIGFNADTFIADIQKMADGSGGYFKVQLTDHRSRYIEDGTWTGIIANPPEVVKASSNEEYTRSNTPPPPPPAPSLKEQLKEFAEMAEILGLKREPNPAPVAPAPQLPPADPAESFLEQFDKFTTISEKLAPSREEKRGVAGFIEGTAQLIDVVGKHAPSILSVVFSLASRAQQQQNGAPQQQQQPAQPAPPSQNAAAMNPAPVNPVMDTLRIIVEDLKADRRVARAADAITALAESDEQLGAMLGGLLARPEPDILRELSQVAVEDLSAYPHAVSWIGELKFELMPDDEEGDEETPEGEGEATAEGGSV